MNMGHRDRPIPPVVANCVEKFKATLAASGAPRGLRAERKSATEGSLFIYDAIGKDPWTGEGVDAKDVLARLDELKGVKRLDVYINSPGGIIWEGKTIYNQLARFNAARVVHVDGIAASAASLIAMAGDRIITEAGGTWLVHRVSGGGWGFSEDLRAVADEIDAETVAIRAIYEKRTGRSAAEIEAWMREDKIVDAVTAKARGWTDEISEADQRRADAVASAAASTPPHRAKTPDELFAQAVADYADIKNRFPGASAGTSHPGQPGAANGTQKPGSPAGVK